MANEICQVPIFKGSKQIVVTTTPQTLEDMGIEFDKTTVQIIVQFEGIWRLKAIGRYAKDPSAVIGPTVGNPIFPQHVVCLNNFETGTQFVAASGTLTAIVHQYTQALECDFSQQYLGIIPQILPEGFAWVAKCDPESNLFRLLKVFSILFSNFHCTALRLVLEMFPGTCIELCDRHDNERFDRQLQECLDKHNLSDAQGKRALLAKIFVAGVTQNEPLIEAALILDLEVTIVDDVPTFTKTFTFINTDTDEKTACEPACAPLVDGPDMNLILAYICIMEKIGSAQTQRIYKIGNCILSIP